MNETKWLNGSKETEMKFGSGSKSGTCRSLWWNCEAFEAKLMFKVYVQVGLGRKDHGHNCSPSFHWYPHQW